ncbi:MAG: S53 family peptidase [Gaiellaceae bacterium]
MNHRRRCRWLVLSAAVAGVAALAAFGGTSRGVAAAHHGTMSPAAGPATLYQSVGRPLAGATGSVLFGCQVTSPAGCYGPDQIRAAYGIQPLLDHGINGSGRTIVIIDAFGSPTIADDLALFDSLWGLPDPPSFQIKAPFGIDPADPYTAAGWTGETSLDVEWAHVVAPKANIVLVEAKSDSDSDMLDATQWVADHNAGDVLSQSYGEAEQCMDPSDLTRQHKLFAKMSKQGVTLLASTGDSGAGQYTCDGNAYFKAVSTPATDPYVTSVGGTILTADGTSGRYQSETAWNETELYGDAAGGGGGVSVLYTRPSYQSSAQRNSMRTVPDVSYNASLFQGVLVVLDGGLYRFGGASAGPPQWAGIVALADQVRRGRIGQINPALYKTRGSRLFFHDVTTGDNSIPDLTPYLGDSYGTPINGYSAGRGYDFVTGLGTPVATALVPYLAIRGFLGDDAFGSFGRGPNGSGHGRHGHMHDH